MNIRETPQAKAALRHRSLSRLARGRRHPGHRGLRRLSVRRRDRAVAALRRQRRRGASQGPRRLRQYVRARHRAGQSRPRRSAISTKKSSTSSKATARPSSNSPTAAARSFEWGAKSLFAIPLNAKHRHFNASGTERALLVSTTNLPMVMNVFHNEAFVFGSTISISPTAPARRNISPAKAISSPCVPATTCGRRISSPI